jgi:hypothetical protein
VDYNIAFGSSIFWNTTSVDGVGLMTQLYSVPAANITISRERTRIGGYFLSAHAWHPTATFKNTTGESYYRITGINTQWQNEPNWTYSNVTVTSGWGTAMSVTNGTFNDLIISSNGSVVSADIVTTDAKVSIVSNISSGLDFAFMRSGTFLNYSNLTYVQANQTLDLLFYGVNGNDINITAQANSPVNVTVKATCNATTVVQKSGVVLTQGSQWECVDADNLWILMTFNSPSDYEIVNGGGTTTTTTSTTTSSSSSSTTSTSSTTTGGGGGGGAVTTTTLVQSTTTTTQADLWYTLYGYVFGHSNTTTTTTTLASYYATTTTLPSGGNVWDSVASAWSGVLGYVGGFFSGNSTVAETSSTTTSSTTSTSTSTTLPSYTTGGVVIPYVSSGVFSGVPDVPGWLSQPAIGSFNVGATLLGVTVVLIIVGGAIVAPVAVAWLKRTI